MTRSWLSSRSFTCQPTRRTKGFSPSRGSSRKRSASCRISCNISVGVWPRGFEVELVHEASETIIRRRVHEAPKHVDLRGGVAQLWSDAIPRHLFGRPVPLSVFRENPGFSVPDDELLAVDPGRAVVNRQISHPLPAVLEDVGLRASGRRPDHVVLKRLPAHTIEDFGMDCIKPFAELIELLFRALFEVAALDTVGQRCAEESLQDGGRLTRVRCFEATKNPARLCRAPRFFFAHEERARSHARARRDTISSTAKFGAHHHSDGQSGLEN